MRTRNQEWKELVRMTYQEPASRKPSGTHPVLEVALGVLVAAAFVGILILFSGCGTLAADHIAADRATWNSLDPWIREKADPNVERDQAKIAIWDAWNLELRAAEGKFQ